MICRHCGLDKWKHHMEHKVTQISEKYELKTYGYITVYWCPGLRTTFEAEKKFDESGLPV